MVVRGYPPELRLLIIYAIQGTILTLKSGFSRRSGFSRSKRPLGPRRADVARLVLPAPWVSQKVIPMGLATQPPFQIQLNNIVIFQPTVSSSRFKKTFFAQSFGFTQQGFVIMKRPRTTTLCTFHSSSIMVMQTLTDILTRPLVISPRA